MNFIVAGRGTGYDGGREGGNKKAIFSVHREFLKNWEF